MSNDDDLYGDLYGNDDGADFPGFVKAESETKESSKPAPAETVPTPTPAVKPTTTTTETKSAPAGPVEKEDPKPVPKKEEPLTNPIPTFTEESGSSYFQGGNKYGQSSGITTNGNNYSPQGHGMGGGQPQPILGVDGTDGGKSRDEGKMFVGGLNWDTTDDGLRNYFSQFGKIDSCTIMRDPAGRSRGFAFLTFEDPAAVNKVMVQEHYLDGKIIDPKRAIPRTEHQRTVKMFVGGLAPSVTSDSMREYFSQFGKVIDATVMVDRDSSRSKGFGFVTFDDQSGAERLFGMPGLQIDGKMIEVKMAQPRAGMAADRQNNMNNRGGGGGGGGYGNNNFNGGGASAGAVASAGAGAGASMGGAGSTPFDPQALATLYQRMAQLAGGAQGGMGWGMNNGMGMNMMGMGGGMGGGGMGMMGGGNMMGGGMGGGGGGAGGGGRHFNGGMNGGGMGMVDGGMGPGGGGGRGNIPRGPAAMRGGAAGGMNAPTGPSGGLGPARMGRGHQHNYHPYSR